MCLLAVAVAENGEMMMCGQVPIVSGGNSRAAAKWESRTVYQPNVAILDDTVYDFYVRSQLMFFRGLFLNLCANSACT